LAAGVEAFRTGATTVVSTDFLVELRGFEPVTSATRHRARLTVEPLPTADGMLSRYVRDGELFLGNAARILL
jgi:hypothetical protein